MLQNNLFYYLISELTLLVRHYHPNFTDEKIVAQAVIGIRIQNCPTLELKFFLPLTGCQGAPCFVTSKKSKALGLTFSGNWNSGLTLVIVVIRQNDFYHMRRSKKLVIKLYNKGLHQGFKTDWKTQETIRKNNQQK